VTSWDRSGNLASQYDAFNGGVKVRLKPDPSKEMLTSSDRSIHINLVKRLSRLRLSVIEEEGRGVVEGAEQREGEGDLGDPGSRKRFMDDI
jgi:hypothetical protein